MKKGGVGIEFKGRCKEKEKEEDWMTFTKGSETTEMKAFSS